mgnify:CR=1 FL=1
MPDHDKIDQVLGMLTVLDSKIGFLEQDLDNIKSKIEFLTEAMADFMSQSEQQENKSKPRFVVYFYFPAALIGS